MQSQHHSPQTSAGFEFPARRHHATIGTRRWNSKSHVVGWGLEKKKSRNRPNRINSQGPFVNKTTNTPSPLYLRADTWLILRHRTALEIYLFFFSCFNFRFSFGVCCAFFCFSLLPLSLLPLSPMFVSPFLKLTWAGHSWSLFVLISDQNHTPMIEYSGGVCQGQEKTPAITGARLYGGGASYRVSRSASGGQWDRIPIFSAAVFWPRYFSSIIARRNPNRRLMVTRRKQKPDPGTSYLSAVWKNTANSLWRKLISENAKSGSAAARCSTTA